MRCRRLRIAFVLPNLDAGGAQRVMLTLVRHLDPTAVEPIVIALTADGVLADQLPPSIERVDLGWRRLSRAWPALFAAIGDCESDVVVSSIWHVNGLLAMRRAALGGPYTVLREANMPDRVAASVPWWLFPRSVYRWAYPRGDLVLASSTLMADALRRAAPAAGDRIAVLPNPVDVAGLRDRAVSPKRKPGRGRRFVTVARLHPQKGIDRLLPLIADLEADDHLTVFGDGPQRATLEALRTAHGLDDRVLLLPRTARPEPWIAGADAVVVPSRWEGLPNVVLEALALGTSVLATPESGGIAEIAEAAPEGALTIVPCGPAMVEAMRRTPPFAPDIVRPSRLPAAYEASAVATAFLALCRDRLAGPDRRGRPSPGADRGEGRAP